MPPSADSARDRSAGPAAEDAARPVTTGRWLACRVGEGLCRLLLRTLRVLPPDRFRRLFAPLLGWLVARAVPHRRIVAAMDAAFGDSYTAAAKRGLARGVQQRMAENILDCLVQAGCPERLREVLEVRGREHLDAALAKGHGVIALGFHLGNFVLLSAAMAVAGCPVHSLIRFLDDERLMNLVLHHSPSFHTRLIPALPRQQAVKRILTALRDNGAVLMLADNLKRGELETTLFGQPVRTARGVASLALRTRAAVLPVYLVRDYSGGLQLVIEPEMDITHTGEPGAGLIAHTDRIMRLLERLVRRYPDQWYWLTAGLGRPQRRRRAGRRRHRTLLDTPQRSDRFH